MENIIGVKELRERLPYYENRVHAGETFIVFKRSRPIFKITAVDEGEWEEVIDFTKIQKGGVPIQDILSRL